MLYCGICHSDIHEVENDWGNTVYPCMPGHEIVGRVTKAGAGVTLHVRFRYVIDMASLKSEMSATQGRRRPARRMRDMRLPPLPPAGIAPDLRGARIGASLSHKELFC